MSQTATAPANAEKRYAVQRADLPLSCPLPSMALWNSHPRVFLPVEATSVIASIGGIAELAKDAMQKQGSSRSG